MRVCGAGAHMCKSVVARTEDTCGPVCYLRPKKWERQKTKIAVNSSASNVLVHCSDCTQSLLDNLIFCCNSTYDV